MYLSVDQHASTATIVPTIISDVEPKCLLTGHDGAPLSSLKRDAEVAQVSELEPGEGLLGGPNTPDSLRSCRDDNCRLCIRQCSYEYYQLTVPTSNLVCARLLLGVKNHIETIHESRGVSLNRTTPRCRLEISEAAAAQEPEQIGKG